MFYYFGRKGRAASTYPAPEYPLVIEPFAGSMAYTLKWRPAHALGIERDKQTVALWHRLCAMSEEELRNFPVPEVGERTSDRWVINSGASNWNNKVHYRTVNRFMVTHFEQQRRMALRHHAYARTVLYAQGDYRQAPDVEATWFIDPPYQGVRDGYRHKDLDYDELAEWCLNRRGQVIICEGPDGSWLPFQHHKHWRGVNTFDLPAKSIVEKVLITRTHRRCEKCSTTFPARRADARFCSDRCRQQASRLRRQLRSVV